MLLVWVENNNLYLAFLDLIMYLVAAACSIRDLDRI
jgi:hypothetical protein